MPKHGLFTTIGKYLGTKVHNLSQTTKKKAEIFRLPPDDYFHVPVGARGLFYFRCSCKSTNKKWKRKKKTL